MLSLNDAQLIVGLLSGQLPTDADRDNPSGTSYFLFVGMDSSWRIMKQVIVSGVSSYRYVRGQGNYATNWALRLSRNDYTYPV